MKKTVSKSFKSSKGFEIARSIKNSIQTSITSSKINTSDRIAVTLTPDHEIRGKVLLSYIIDGFLLGPNDPIPSKHTNIWQSLKMAEIFVELGYEVDVISYKNNTFIPISKYSVFIDVRKNMKRLTPFLNEDCIKIAHLDTSNILFHNAAEAKRLLELQQRRGITIRANRYENPSYLIEHADYATLCGNEAAIKTYDYAEKKIFQLPSPCAITYDWADDKDFDKTCKHFLWFSSSGLVHKGLDLVLEAFQDLPDYHLTICAPTEKDSDFLQAFKDEIYNSQNINLIGWVDIESNTFTDIANKCVAMLHTSCSEAGAPSVKTCMHAGLIPIVSYETAVDMDDFGVILKNCTIEEIQTSVKYIANLPKENLKIRSKKAWDQARKHHTRENFSIKYKEVVLQILGNNKH